MWVRAIIVIVGAISVVLAGYVLLFPTVALVTLIFLLSLGFLFNGLARMLIGITGIETEKI